MSGALIVCITLHIGAGLLDFGSRAFVWWLVPPGPLAENLGCSLQRLDRPVLAILLGSAAAWLAVQTGDLDDSWSAAGDPTRLAAVVTGTTFGAWWATHLLTLGSLAATIVLGAWPGLRLAASTLVLSSLAFTGHSSLHVGVVWAVHVWLAVTHLLAVGAWLGGLVPLLLVMRRMTAPDEQSAAAAVLRRFSRLGHAIVAAAVMSGAALSGLVVDGRPFEASAAYLTILLAKASVAALMIGLALVNRYALVPRLAAAPSARVWLVRLTVCNVALGALALILASDLGRTDPAP